MLFYAGRLGVSFLGRDNTALQVNNQLNWTFRSNKLLTTNKGLTMESPYPQGLKLKTEPISPPLDTLLFLFRWSLALLKGKLRLWRLSYLRHQCFTTRGHPTHQQELWQAVTTMEELEEDITMDLSPLTFSLVLQGSRRGTGLTPWTPSWWSRRGMPDSLYLFRFVSFWTKLVFIGPRYTWGPIYESWCI